MTSISLLGLLWILSLILMSWGTLLSLIKRKSAPTNKSKLRPPISILKPVKGIDSGLAENLESFMQLDYPSFEILFSVADHDDPCIPIIQKVMSKFPHIKTKLILGDVKATANPKVNNMLQSFDTAQHDWILVSDSNVRVPKNYLAKLASLIKPKTGVISGIVHGINPMGLGGHLESIYLNTFYARFVRLAMHFDKPCVIGKSMLFRKSVANMFGGLKTFGLYLAEDYMFGEAVRKVGLKVQIMPFPVNQHIGKYSFMDFWNRHVRWGRIRRAQAFFATLLEPLICSYVVTLAFGMAYLTKTFGWSILEVTALHSAVWFGNEFVLLGLAQEKNRSLRLLYALIREIVYIPLWVTLISGDSVLWRGQKIRVVAGGMIANNTQPHIVGSTGEHQWLILNKNRFFGVWQQALTKLKATMKTMIGGIGKNPDTFRAAPTREWLATTGTDFVRIFDLRKTLPATPTDFLLSGLASSQSQERSMNQPFPGITI